MLATRPCGQSLENLYYITRTLSRDLEHQAEQQPTPEKLFHLVILERAKISVLNAGPFNMYSICKYMYMHIHLCRLECVKLEQAWEQVVVLMDFTALLELIKKL